MKRHVNHKCNIMNMMSNSCLKATGTSSWNKQLEQAAGLFKSSMWTYLNNLYKIIQDHCNLSMTHSLWRINDSSNYSFRLESVPFFKNNVLKSSFFTQGNNPFTLLSKLRQTEMQSRYLQINSNIKTNLLRSIHFTYSITQFILNGRKAQGISNCFEV